MFGVLSDDVKKTDSFIYKAKHGISTDELKKLKKQKDSPKSLAAVFYDLKSWM